SSPAASPTTCRRSCRRSSRRCANKSRPWWERAERMEDEGVPSIRIKIYGLFPLTKRTYLRVQVIGLLVLLGLMAVCGSAMVLTGRWRPEFRPKDFLSL